MATRTGTYRDDSGSRFSLGGYTTVDPINRHWKARLNVSNVFDNKYFGSI